MSTKTQVRHGASQPVQVDRDVVYIQHDPDSLKVLGIWVGNKGDHRKCVQNQAVQHAGDGNDLVMKPEDKYAGMDTSTSPAQTTFPPVDDIEDGHEIIVDDEGGNATNNAITLATPDDATIEGSATGTIGTNDGKRRFMYDEANDNWVNVS